MLPQELEQAARLFGQSLRQQKAVRRYLETQARLDADPDVRDLDERFRTMYQELGDRQRAGERLTPQELNEFYALRGQVQQNQLITERDDALNEVKEYFIMVGMQFNQALGIDFVTLAAS